MSLTYSGIFLLIYVFGGKIVVSTKRATLSLNVMKKSALSIILSFSESACILLKIATTSLSPPPQIRTLLIFPSGFLPSSINVLPIIVPIHLFWSSATTAIEKRWSSLPDGFLCFWKNACPIISLFQKAIIPS